MLSDLNRVDFANVQVPVTLKKQTLKKIFTSETLIFVVSFYYSIKKVGTFLLIFICAVIQLKLLSLHFGCKENKTSEPLSISIFSEGLSFTSCILPIFI